MTEAQRKTWKERRADKKAARDALIAKNRAALEKERAEHLRRKEENARWRDEGGQLPILREVGDQGSGQYACIRCGSNQFEGRRSVGGRVAFGLLASNSEVVCVICGAKYRRG